ncbi:MAG: tRNA uridine-5-carboxymethylaminomethyl(34) synthesis GTPase MnmE, partial [Bacilli bacterium]|nr:tRNA uridine-5-carboxymethylaminomethyl(34) synthesis GTPase MnmE [Bacilli bacterium]
MDNTICAISTSSGMGAISIIRVSGNEAVGIVNKIFKGHRLDKVASHTINYGHIIDENNKIIDEVLVSVMLAPKTYTTEDTIEINCHGGLISANKILQLLVKNGCALAEPGEFTKRAFLNGRMGLVEAEAVSEIINSETNKSQELAVNQLSGKISNKIKTLRSNIMDVLSFIEVTIDYPEYTDIDTLEDEEMIKKIKETKETIEHLIKESENGKVIQNGINVALIGEPNVGKSSLMNALIGEERAIVTNIAGTTRDSIEAKFTLKNIAINLIDTAGIHETDDIIEQIGIDKSLKAIEEADLII